MGCILPIMIQNLNSTIVLKVNLIGELLASVTLPDSITVGTFQNLPEDGEGNIYVGALKHAQGFRISKLLPNLVLEKTVSYTVNNFNPAGKRSGFALGITRNGFIRVFIPMYDNDLGSFVIQTDGTLLRTDRYLSGRILSPNQFLEPTGFLEARDGNFIITGRINSSVLHIEPRLMLIKIAPGAVSLAQPEPGAFIWGRFINNASGRAIKETIDGDLLFVGGYFSGKGRCSFLFAKTRPNGIINNCNRIQNLSNLTVLLQSNISTTHGFNNGLHPTYNDSKFKNGIAINVRLSGTEETICMDTNSTNSPTCSPTPAPTTASLSPTTLNPTSSPSPSKNDDWKWELPVFVVLAVIICLCCCIIYCCCCLRFKIQKNAETNRVVRLKNFSTYEEVEEAGL